MSSNFPGSDSALIGVTLSSLCVLEVILTEREEALGRGESSRKEEEVNVST